MYEAIASIIGGAIVLSAAIIKFIPRRLGNGDSGLHKELTECARRQIDLLQEMRGEHKVQQLMLEQITRSIDRVDRHASE